MREDRDSSSERPFTIGLLTDSLSSAYAAEVWRGVGDVTQERGCSLVCFVGGKLRSTGDNALYDLVGSDSVDGLVVLSNSLGAEVGPDALLDFCERYRPLPVVSVAAALEGIPSVLTEDGTGMQTLVAHLLDHHGYRRIAFVQASETQQEADACYHAYTQALAEHGLPLDRRLVVRGEPGPSAGGDAVRLLLDQRGINFDALVATDDGVALGAIEALQARGRRVPGDVAVAGFGDLEEARSVTPPLTTVRQPAYEVGRRAAGVLLAQLQGEPVPERTIVLPELVQRQSCGCLARSVVHAAAGQAASAGIDFETALGAQREQIVSALLESLGIQAGAGQGARGRGWIEQLLNAFAADLTGRVPGGFLSTLSEVLRHVRAMGWPVDVWQETVSEMRQHVLPCIGELSLLPKAEDLWQQARTLVAEAIQRVQIALNVEVKRRASTLQEIGQALITTFDMETLLRLIARELPRLNVPGCYLSLCDGEEGEKEGSIRQSRLIMAYDQHGPVALPASGERFPSHRLLPGRLLPQDRQYSFVVEPLHVGDERLGFVLFEAHTFVGDVYDVLRAQLSSALQGARLVQQVQERTHTLQAANDALQRRAVQMEVSAEIGRTVTSILDPVQLMWQAVDLIRSRFGLYFAGLFLLDKSGEWAVLAEATGEAGAQMKSDGLRIPVGEGSMVGWTAHHRKPRLAKDVAQEPNYLNHSMLPHTRSELTFPLLVAGRLLGVLDLQSSDVSAFDEEDVGVFQSMADQISVAVDNALRVSQEVALLEATSPVYRAGRRLTVASTTAEVADAVITSVAETGVDGCVMVEFELGPGGSPEALLYLGVWRQGREPQFRPGLRLPLSQSPFPLEMVNAFQVIADVERDERLPQSARRAFLDTDARAVVNIPLQVGQRVIGQVVVLRDTAGPFPESALRLYETLSDQAAVALERVRLLELADRRLNEEARLRAIGDRFARALDLETLLRSAADELGSVLHATGVCIVLDPEIGAHSAQRTGRAEPVAVPTRPNEDEDEER